MSLKRRDFIKFSVAGATSVGISSVAHAEEMKSAPQKIRELQSMVQDVAPITVEERKKRIEKAQRLMIENKINAVFIEGGTSLNYFTGVQWGNSERMMAAIIPAKGEVKYVCPHFEEERLRELIKIGNDVRVWEEDESPYKLVARIFSDLGIRNGKVGMEERVRFFLFDGIRKEASHLEYVSADPITAACRIIKSPTELALMQKASDITLEAFKISVSMLSEGMTQQDLGALISQASSKLGGSRAGTLISFGAATAFPHGSSTPQKLKKGDVVLMDGGCTVHGYVSDITRTVVFGEPTARQRQIWNLEKAAQLAGFEAAKLGSPCENVDIAARKVITDAGFGPGYKLPGLPHRTGHGIGMDGHEWGNMVLGNKQPLQVGMCFSIEPTISIYGEFGVRLEDCAYMTEQGVKWFTEQSPSLDKPFL